MIIHIIQIFTIWKNIQKISIMNIWINFRSVLLLKKNQKYYLNNFIKEENKSLFEIKPKSGKKYTLIEIDNNLDEADFTKITDNYFLKYSKKENNIEVLKYDSDLETMNELEQEKTAIENEIESISVFDNLNQIYTIYICLLGNNKIVIYDFNLNKETLTK